MYEDLSLPSLFGIVDGVQCIIEDAGFDHCDSFGLDDSVLGWLAGGMHSRFSTR